jgi:hypothetical protein
MRTQSSRSESGPERPDLNQLSRAAIKRRSPVQKLCQFTHPLSIQVDDGCRLVPCGTSGSSFLRTCGWGGVAKLFSFVGDVVCRINEPGPCCEQIARGPGGRTTRGVDRWRPCPIKSTESRRAQHRPAVLGHQWVWSVTRGGIGFMPAPVRRPVHGRQGQISLCSRPRPGGRGQRPFCF